MVPMARAAADWATPTLTDEALEVAVPCVRRQAAREPGLSPDSCRHPPGAQRPGVTLMLLWEEYWRGNALAYKYTSFASSTGPGLSARKRLMRQVHPAGERLLGPRRPEVEVVDATTGGDRPRPDLRGSARGIESTRSPAPPPPRRPLTGWPSMMFLFIMGTAPGRLTRPRADRQSRPIMSPPRASVEEFSVHYDVAVPGWRARPPGETSPSRPACCGSSAGSWRLRNRRFLPAWLSWNGCDRRPLTI